MTIALAITTVIGITVAICAVAFARTVVAQAARDRAGDRATIDMLCQRIQAPQQAVATYAGEHAGPDPAPLDLENDEQMSKAREERERAWL